MQELLLFMNLFFSEFEETLEDAGFWSVGRKSRGVSQENFKKLSPAISDPHGQDMAVVVDLKKAYLVSIPNLALMACSVNLVQQLASRSLVRRGEKRTLCASFFKLRIRGGGAEDPPTKMCSSF